MENNLFSLTKKIIYTLKKIFPENNYQTHLNTYLSTKGITDAAQLESYILQYNYQLKKTS